MQGTTTLKKKIYIYIYIYLYSLEKDLDIRSKLAISKKCDSAEQVCTINVLLNSFVE